MRMFLLALLALPHQNVEEGRIEGLVLDELQKPVVGANVQLLKDGLFPIATMLTSENGTFESQVEIGLYDVRVIDALGNYLAGFARDLKLRAGDSLRHEIRLVPKRRALTDLGLLEDTFRDGDSDWIPERLEPATRTQDDERDSSGDGVPDGMAVLLGVDVLRGKAESTRAAPGIHWPTGDVRLPVVDGVAPPVGILFDTVPGATGYRLTVREGSRDLDVRDFDFVRGAVLVGHGALIRWVPPAGFAEGKVNVELQGYYLTAKQEVGSPAEAEFVFEEHDELEDVVIEEKPDQPLVYTGTWYARSWRFLQDTVIRVPAGETLILAALEEIRLEHDVRILAGEGASVVLTTRGDVACYGQVIAGNGRAGEPLEDVAAGRKPVQVLGNPGENGGSLFVFASGSVVVGQEGRLAAGHGGAGGSAYAAAQPTYDALAVGGRGGAGGSLVVSCENLRVADRPERLVSGYGGAGGDARARGGDAAGDPAGHSSALPGVGGDAGRIFLSDWDLRRDGFVALDDESYPIAGGVAGDAGELEAIRPSQGSLGRDASGRAHQVICGEPAGRGWYRGGTGQHAYAHGGDGSGEGDGGQGTAQGGPGGEVFRVGVSHEATDWTFAFLPRGGEGGRAEARGGRSPKGSGGSAFARAGDGGLGPNFAIAFLGRGGRGGDAKAVAVDGVEGEIGCPHRGGNGTAGGSAEAHGGNGGLANAFGGDGGNSTVTAGNGGSGGTGHSPGRGGYGGRNISEPGEGRLGILGDGREGSANAAGGNNGARGPSCPIKHD